MLDLLRAYYLERWENFFPSMKQPPRLAFVCMIKKWKKILWVLDGRRPVVVAKISPSDFYPSDIAHEHESLLQLRHQLIPEYCNTIPKPLALDKINEHLVLSMTYLSGKPMDETLPLETVSRRQEFFRQVEVALEWLAGFQKQMKTEEIILSEEQIESKLIRPIMQLLSQSPSLAAETEFVARYCSAIRDLRGERISSLWCHGDFYPGNILSSGRRLAITDWADMSHGGGPLDDVFFFFCGFRLSVQENSNPDNIVKAFSTLFFRENYLSGRVRELIYWFSNIVGMDDQIVPLLFPLFLVKMALSEKTMNGWKSEMQGRQFWMERLIFYAQHA